MKTKLYNFLALITISISALQHGCRHEAQHHNELSPSGQWTFRIIESENDPNFVQILISSTSNPQLKFISEEKFKKSAMSTTGWDTDDTLWLYNTDSGLYRWNRNLGGKWNMRTYDNTMNVDEIPVFILKEEPDLPKWIKNSRH